MNILFMDNTAELQKLIEEAKKQNWLDITAHHFCDFEESRKYQVNSAYYDSKKIICDFKNKFNNNGTTIVVASIEFSNIKINTSEGILLSPWEINPKKENKLRNLLWTIEGLKIITDFAPESDIETNQYWSAQQFINVTKIHQDNICSSYSAEKQFKLYILKELAQLNPSIKSKILMTSFPDLIESHSFDLKKMNPMERMGAVDLQLKILESKNTRDDLYNSTKRTYEASNNIYKRYNSSIRQKYEDIAYFIPLRRWNSWTPAQPTTNTINNREILPKTKVGGGYLVSSGKNNIAVDPGFGFLDSIYNEYRITIRDIDAVIISHDHNDHSADLLNILSLRFKYQDECSGKLKVLLNPSSCYLYSHILEYYNSILDTSTQFTFSPGATKNVGDITVRSIAMEHDEIFHYLSPKPTKHGDSIDSQALGLIFKMDGLKIGIVGDTKFSDDNAQILTWANFFKDVNFLALHVGCLEEDWGKRCKPAKEIVYSSKKRGHLGLVGIIKFLELVTPDCCILSEFGEELAVNSLRKAIPSWIKKTLSYKLPIISTDTGLFLCKWKDGTLCFRCACSEKKGKDNFVPIEYIHIREGDTKLIYEAECGCASNHFTLTFDD
ncbi:MBL fold metallo-hydrolase [Maridesulfovibrio bastinii]|uniref:MBL fold metallo-hydrolase n=1 Tax=Maridesulfovibrio bastinii TaxID=47157 RepID=UPI000427968A|nr:MBL fold metallo-hydrolase [Maridesulfovibrio bastinii]